MSRMDLVGLKLRSDLLQWAERSGADFRRTMNEWRSACPIHGGNNEDGFVVYEEDGCQKWKCFTGPCGCGDIYDFIRKVNNDCTLEDAYRILGGEEQPDPAAIARAAAERARRAEVALREQIEKAQRALEELQRAQTWLTYHETLMHSDRARALWRGRGVPDDWQDFWKLGACREFTYTHHGETYHSPTLTIPIHAQAWQVVNVRHRLLNPVEPNDKYRPDRPGLQAAPFIANPDIGYDTGRVLVVEGEIKGMVTYSTIYRDGSDLQVIGVPGKTQFRALVELLRGKDVYLCFDPDAGQEAQEAARLVGGARVISLPMKIDDAILAGQLDAGHIFRFLNMSRK
jgi:hypothetical protein